MKLLWMLELGAWNFSLSKIRITAAPRRAASINPCRHAFTLIELMVVVTLVGILTALIIPEMKGSYQAALLRSTSRDLINIFDLTYSRAVSLNQIRRVRLDERTGRYSVEKQVIDVGREAFVPVDDAGCSGELNPKITLTLHRPDDPAITASDSPPVTQPPGDAARPMAEDTRSMAESARPTVEGDQPEVGTTIAFYPDGTADAAVIELADQDGFRLALKINPITARIHVEELERQ